MGVVIVAKFVELHYKGDPILVNLDKTECFMLFDGVVCAKVSNNAQAFDESYDEVKTIIGAAQGGIPMEPGRMY